MTFICGGGTISLKKIDKPSLICRPVVLRFSLFLHFNNCGSDFIFDKNVLYFGYDFKYPYLNSKTFFRSYFQKEKYMFKKLLRLFKTPKNEVHPEMREGEVFFTNVGEYDALRSYEDDDFNHIGWKSKRKGSVAFDIDGKPVNYMNPVFVMRDELILAGINPDNILNKKKRRDILFAIGCIGALVTALTSLALYRLWGIDAGLWVIIPMAFSIWSIVKGAF